jgi:hypothetical protein
MKNLGSVLVAASISLIVLQGVASAQAPAPTPSSLVPCAFEKQEVMGAMGFAVETADSADMTTPVGRDVGCLYSLKGSDFVFGVRQTWDSTRTAPNQAPVGAPTATGGQVVYIVGKIQITVFWHGGNLASTDGIQRLMGMRRLP